MALSNHTFAYLQPRSSRRQNMSRQLSRATHASFSKSLGATPVGENQTKFRVWAPHRKSISVRIQEPGGQQWSQRLERDWAGYFQGTVNGVSAGARYQYVLDDSVQRPDPASSFQPDGVHGDSQVIGHDAYAWQDVDWSGVAKADLVIYELHIGTFTEQGNFAAASRRLDELTQLGVTAVELMPVAQASGRWNWGYDGVGLYAPSCNYGHPDEFKAFVDACHARGLAVILDVVYNHVGPEGNYLADFGPYFSNKHHTPWGGAFDFDGHGAAPVRRFIAGNAVYWLDKYHLDGLRLDAVHFMHDESDDVILDEIRRDVARFERSAGRHVHLIAEANIYDPHLLAGDGQDHPPYDAIWCDDIMHAVYSIATSEIRLTNREYGGWNDLLEALRHGYLYLGPHTRRVGTADRERLTPDADARHLSSLVVALQTHDSVGNHPHGKRLHELASTEFQKAAAALVLLYPAIPLIFMGEECALPAPFHFFVDFQDRGLRKAVNRGRAAEYPQHLWHGAIPPTVKDAFYHSKYTSSGDRSVWGWYQALLRVRREWRRNGWLVPGSLRVDEIRDARIIILRYETAGQRDHFVIARLDSPADVETPAVAVEIDGQILLNSREDRTAVSGDALQLRPCQAVIGTGTVHLPG